METTTTTITRHTCLKLEIPNTPEPIFVKGTWFHSHFHLSISDGLDAWLCNATEEEVRDRAAQWDQPVIEYINLAERYLGFQQPGSVYSFTDAGDGYKRLSWTFEKNGIKLEWRWKCRSAPNSKEVTAGILDFLMDENIKLSDEVVKKDQSYKRLKVEAEKCLAQSERFSNEKVEFESEIYSKFVAVLNSKKAKLRDLQEQLSNKKSAGNLPEEEEESTDKTQSFDEGSDDEKSDKEPLKDFATTSKGAPASSARGQKRITRK
ncbi:hypothetical protein ACOSP7_006881 [Xanthoceras sorbifolium]|uniref:DNA repair protein XRCC4 n=1 Tax=Xanthoceras sorbifolium TaxID=99658 RepID=A0ABQ8I9H8_9ROSI|nr:hypothetical protein JRO89_XS03G0111100 [Xanthoceras sorbifolium]